MNGYEVSDGPRMCDLVYLIVQSALPRDVPEEVRDRNVEAVHDKLRQQSMLAPQTRMGPQQENAIYDGIMSSLIKSDVRNADGVEGHLRFQGLYNQLRHVEPFRAQHVRRGVLSILHLLRQSGEEANDAAPGFSAFATPHENGSGGGRPIARPLKQLSQTHRDPSWSGSFDEGQVLRDLLYALQGVESVCFRAKTRGIGFEPSSSLSISRPVAQLVERILELADIHKRICAATNQAMESEAAQTHSLLHQALCEVVRSQLLDYYKLIAMLTQQLGLEHDVSAGERMLTLRRLWLWVEEPLQRMKLLDSVCSACASLRGGALASEVYRYSKTGDPVAQSALSDMLLQVTAPLLAMIRAWMTEGELRDPHGEFFVCADATVQKEDLWTRMYHLEIEMVPCFIKFELARKILLSGKSINFIRLCCQERDVSGEATELGQLLTPEALSPDSSAVTLRPEALDGLEAVVEAAAERTNRRLVALLMDRYKLLEHAKAIRLFLLLGQGDFIECLIDLADAELRKDAKEIYRHNMMGILDMAVRQSNAQFCAPDTINRLGVRLMEPSLAETGWDVFSLEYHVDNSPMQVVFTPGAMQQYDRAFSFLWKLRRISHALVECWSRQKLVQHHLNQPDFQLAQDRRAEVKIALHTCTCLRNEMYHFIQNVQSYVTYEVLETSWNLLQEGWKSCTDLDQVIQKHETYLLCLQEGAFLTPQAEKLHMALQGLFNLALRFTELHDQSCASAAAALEGLHDQFEAPSWAANQFARAILQCRGELNKISIDFLQKLQALMRELESQPAFDNLSSDLRYLICRLDFNKYYEEKKDKEKDEMPSTPLSTR